MTNVMGQSLTSMLQTYFGIRKQRAIKLLMKTDIATILGKSAAQALREGLFNVLPLPTQICGNIVHPCAYLEHCKSANTARGNPHRCLYGSFYPAQIVKHV